LTKEIAEDRQGFVSSAEPQEDKRTSDSGYLLALRYRGHTGYGDGNPFAVIDSEMPETLRRLGLLKTGDALPVPPRMPRACTRLVMRKSVEWCEPH
jgi:hypothetical protein